MPEIIASCASRIASDGAGSFIVWQDYRSGEGDIYGARLSQGGTVLDADGVAITTVLFYGAHRIRAPAEPAVVALAAAGIVALVDRIRRPTGAPRRVLPWGPPS